MKAGEIINMSEGRIVKISGPLVVADGMGNVDLFDALSRLEKTGSLEKLSR